MDPHKVKIVHPVSLLSPAEYHIVDHEGLLLDIAVVVLMQTIQVLGCPNTCDQAFFLKSVDIVLSCLIVVLFIIVLYPWCSESDIGR